MWGGLSKEMMGSTISQCYSEYSPVLKSLARRLCFWLSKGFFVFVSAAWRPGAFCSFLVECYQLASQGHT